MIKILSYVLRLVIVVGVLVWLYASWTVEEFANIKQTKQVTMELVGKGKKVITDAVKEELKEELEEDGS